MKRVLSILAIACLYSMAIQGAATVTAVALSAPALREQIENYITGNNSQALEKMLAEQAKINSKVLQEAINAPQDERTPLQTIFYQSEMGNLKNGMELLRIILNNGANITFSANAEIPAPLHGLAIDNRNHVEAINVLLRGRQHLVDYPVENNSLGSENRGATPLMLTLDAMLQMTTRDNDNNILANARALLDNGADVTARYPDGTTILARAQEKSPRMYELLNEYHKAQVAAKKK